MAATITTTTPTEPAGLGVQETPDLFGAFPRLTEPQIAGLIPYGERLLTRAGDVLFRQGDRRDELFVILDGKVAVVETYGDEEQVLGVHGPGRFLGELGLLTGEAAFVSAVVKEPGEVLAVPADRLREVAAQDPTLGDLVLRACILRRSLLIGLGTGVKVIGSGHSPDTRRLRDFLARNRIPHRWMDLEHDGEAEALVQRLGVDPEDTPIVILRDHVLRNPSNSDVARFIGLSQPVGPGGQCDLVVVGGGPAGLAAAVYGASEGLSTVVLEGVAAGGQAGTSPKIENYLGFPAGISGSELAERAVVQAERFGARISVPAEAASLERRDGRYVVKLEDGSHVCGRTVLIATGVRYRKLDVARLAQFEGTSVYYAATEMEARVCVADPIAVVGGGNSAGQAALFLARHAAVVRLLVRSDDLRRDMSRYLVDQIERSPDIEVLLNTEVRELEGDDRLEEIVVDNSRTGERRALRCRALFVFVGAEPHARWLRDQIALDEQGFVLTGAYVPPSRRDPYDHEPLFLETSLTGVFAAGDVRSRSIKRVASAVGEGAMAVRLIHDHLEAHGRQAVP